MMQLRRNRSLQKLPRAVRVLSWVARGLWLLFCSSPDDMCLGDCQTFLWGGEGVPTHNGGQCSCVCQNSSWSNLNLLGRPSCVPVKAHQIFGWAGLAASVVSLAHVIYHLRRQVRWQWDPQINETPQTAVEYTGYLHVCALPSCR